jgi:transposase
MTDLGSPYLGLVPEEYSSGERRCLGHISKQGSGILRFSWWKRRRSRHGAIQSGAASTSIWLCDEDGRSPR